VARALVAVWWLRAGGLVDSTNTPPPADRPRFWIRTADAVSGVSELLLQEAPPADQDGGFFVGGGVRNIFHPHNRIFTIDHFGADTGLAPTPALPPAVPRPPALSAPGAWIPSRGERVVLYGANGMMGPETVKSLRQAPNARPVLATDVGAPVRQPCMHARCGHARLRCHPCALLHGIACSVTGRGPLALPLPRDAGGSRPDRAPCRTGRAGDTLRRGRRLIPRGR
jgi:hypothetical protein